MRALVCLFVLLVGCGSKDFCPDPFEPDPTDSFCECSGEATLSEDGLGCDLPDGGTALFPDGTRPDASTRDDAGAFDAGTGVDSDAPDAPTSECGDASDCPAVEGAEPTCESGMCGFRCIDPFDDCDGRADNGCEVDLRIDDEHCGTCDNHCESLACRDRACVDIPVEVCTGHYHSCARQASGRVKCWGGNEGGQLGDGSFEDSSTPVDTGISDAIDVDCGAWYFSGSFGGVSCAIRSDNSLWCWGRNDRAMVGDGSVVDRNVPVRVDGIEDVIDVHVGVSHVCAATALGQVFCWGQLLGDTYRVPTLRPEFGRRVREVGEICALNRDGTVACLSDDFTAAQVAELSDEVAVLVSAARSNCAAGYDRIVRCWGSNPFGELGTELPTGMTPREEPLPVQEMRVRADLLAGKFSSFYAVDQETNAVWIWGLDHRSVGPDSESQFQRTPIRFTDLPALRQLDAHSAHACAVTESGNVLCWGGNTHGQLGHGGPESASADPVVVFGYE